MRCKIFFLIMLAVIAVSNIYAQKMTVKNNSSKILMEVNDEGTMGSITLPDTNTTLSQYANKLYNLNGFLMGMAILLRQALLLRSMTLQMEKQVALVYF